MSVEPTTLPSLRFEGFDDEWKVTRFEEELVDSKLGGNYSNSETPTDHPLIKMGNLGRGDMNLRKLEYIQDGEEINPDDRMKNGDLFFNTRNTLELVGKVAIWRSELPEAYFNSNLMRIEFACNHFMNYRLNSFGGIKSLRRLATGTTSVAAIYTRDLLKMKITVPTLPEQRKIADFLTAVDERIGQLIRKRALLEDYKKGVMQQLFSQAIRFQDDHGNDFPDWEEKTLGEVSHNVGYGMNAAAAEFDGVTKYIRITDIDEDSNKFRPDPVTSPDEKAGDQYKLKKGDIVFARTGASVGKSYLYDEADGNLAFAGFLIRFSIREEVANPFFVFLQTLTHAYRKWVKVYSMRSGQPGINAEEYKTFSMPMPSLEEQTKIANFLSAIDRKIEAVSTQITETKTFKRGLLQQMFV